MLFYKKEITVGYRGKSLVTEEEKPKYKIVAKNIGPLLDFEGILSDNKRNVILAKNGTGKSFLSRATHLISHDEQEGYIEAKDLISEEHGSNEMSLKYMHGSNLLGGYTYNPNTKEINRDKGDLIFHVFSQCYLDEHLKAREYKPDGNISQKIIVGDDNINLDKEKTQLEDNKKHHDTLSQNIQKDFLAQKSKLQKELGIGANLETFKNLSPITVISASPEIISLQKTLSEISYEYTNIKNFPETPNFPSYGNTKIEYPFLNDELLELMSKPIIPSNITKDIKIQIESCNEFYKTGVKLLSDHEKECPFCRQNLNDDAVKLIEKYKAYFEDQEAKAKETINKNIRYIEDTIKQLETFEKVTLKAQNDYNELKTFFPDFRNRDLHSFADVISEIHTALKNIESLFQYKLENLTEKIGIDFEKLKNHHELMGKILEENEAIFKEIKKKADNIAIEKTNIRKQACLIFESEFINSNIERLKELQQLSKETHNLEVDIREKERTNAESVNARKRVADTFTMLLKFVFGNKYVFNSNDFSIEKGEGLIVRGADKTLSDGEKSILGFCYYIAQSHILVENKDDYKNIFYVIDDPVTSMSYDYIHSLIQILKNWKIKANGEFTLNGQNIEKPKFLILTHSHILFNIASNNNLTDKRCYFLASLENKKTVLKCQNKFLSMHDHQLRHICLVSENKVEPELYTANYVRSVIEGVQRFCRPDKINLQEFVEVLASEHGISVKSVFINQFCHSNVESIPNDNDLKLACDDALEVVRCFAAGQLKNIQ